MITVILVMFVLYALIFMTPLEKLDAACKPAVAWPGKAISSGARLFDADMARKIEVGTDKTFNGCRRWLWNAFYDEQYQRIKAQERKQQ